MSGDRAAFEALFRQRLHRALITEAERQLARVERDDVFDRPAALLRSAELLRAAECVMPLGDEL